MLTHQQQSLRPNEVGVAEATQVELNTHLPCQLHTEHKRL